MKGSVPGSALVDCPVVEGLAVVLGVVVVGVVLVGVVLVAPALPVDEDAGADVVLELEGADVDGDVEPDVDGVEELEDGAEEPDDDPEEPEEGGEEPASGSTYCWSPADEPGPCATATAGPSIARQTTTISQLKIYRGCTERVLQV